MSADQRAVTIGVILSVLVAIAVVAVIVSDHEPRESSIFVTILFEQPGALQTDADVQLAGRVIGRVQAIGLVSASESTYASQPLYPKEGVAAVVRLSKEYLPWLTKSSEFFVTYKGIRGKAYLEVGPSTKGQGQGQGQGAILQDGDLVRGVEPVRMEDIILVGYMNTQRLMALVKDLESDAAELRAQFGVLVDSLAKMEPNDASYPSLVESIQQVMQERRQFAATLASIKTSGLIARGQAVANDAQRQWSTIGTDGQGLLRHLQGIDDAIPNELRVSLQQTIATNQDTIRTLTGVLATIETLSTLVANAEGTIGALWNDPEFSDDAKQLGRYLKRHPWELLLRPKN